MPEIIIEDCAQFRQLYELSPDINLIICIGGRGGRKTYEVSKFIAKSASIDKKRCVILRDEKELIRESILSDILARYDAANEYGHLDQVCERLDTGLKDRKTGENLVFTKGFRASDNQKKANLKGAANIDIAVVEEAEDIRDEDKFNTFLDSIRKPGSIVIIILNTPDVNHWIVKRYFNLAPARIDGAIVDGYFEIMPKVLKGYLCIQSDYTQNPYLPQHVVDRYKGYGDPNSNSYNPHHFYTSIKGWASTGRKGQILTKVKPIKLADYMALPFDEVYGQDFGTGSHAPLGGFKFNGNNSYIRGIDYDPKNTIAIGKLYARLGFTKKEKIIADSAEPDTITKLQSGWDKSELQQEDIDLYPQLLRGFHVVDAIKGPGSVEASIGLLTGMNLFAVEEHSDVWTEIQNWVYDTDVNNNPTNKPKKGFDHYMACWRYVATDYKGLPSNTPVKTGKPPQSKNSY